MTQAQPLPLAILQKPHPLQFQILSNERASTVPRSKILGVIKYGNEFRQASNVDGYPSLSLAMRPDETQGAFSEVWCSDNEVQCGTNNELFFAHDGFHLFCAGTIAKSSLCRSLTKTAYSNAFKLMEELGYRQLFRMWNFIPDINKNNAADLETYRDFCAGRSEAFAECADKVMQMPAATGIGMADGQISFYFLAARAHQVIHLENPRQIPAYTYPRAYGPKSPSFSRATVLHHEHAPDRSIFVAGTASIIGHATVFADDIEKQCDVTLENIALLVSEKNLADHLVSGSGKLPDMRGVKVYVRRASDIPYVRQRCREIFAEDAFKILNVDVCRADLLVEIEGIVPLREAEHAGQ